MKTFAYLYLLPFFVLITQDFSKSNTIPPIPLGTVQPPTCLNCSADILEPVYEHLDSYVSTCNSCLCQRITKTFTVTVPVNLNNDCTQNYDSSNLIIDYIDINLYSWLTPGNTIGDYSITILSTPISILYVLSSISIRVYLIHQCPS